MFKHIPGKWISTGKTEIAEAVLFAEDFLHKELGGHKGGKTTLREFAEDFFAKSDPYNIRQRDKQYGRIFEETHYLKANGYLRNYILPRFGAYNLTGITSLAIENWFLNLYKKNGDPLSNDTKNRILQTLTYILEEARRRGFVEDNESSKVHKTTVHNERREVFTPDELKIMFPHSDSELLKIWKTNFWATYFLILKDTGFRPGEIAALKISNYYPFMHGLYSTNSVNYASRQLKGIKTSHIGKTYKVGLLTEQTERFLNALIEKRKKERAEFLFQIDGRFIAPTTSNKYFKNNAPLTVNLKGRTQYCLRHSFETDIAGKVENKVVAELMAYTKFNPTYDHRTPETILRELQPVRELLESR